MSCGKEHTFGAEERGRDKNKSPASRFQDCHEPPFALKFDIEVYHDLSPLTSAPNVLFTTAHCVLFDSTTSELTFSHEEAPFWVGYL